MTTSIAGSKPAAGQPGAASGGPDSVAAATTATGGIRRLNPADGLFLRSEHLNQMQAYSRELALAVGIAGGTGVVYGYQLSLSDAELTVTPGLAIDAAGMPLRTGAPVTVQLEGLATPPGRFWLVEVIADRAVPSDNEPVYGNLCADPCSGGSIQPWLDDAVRVQVSARDTLPGLASVASANRVRNWLASAYFEQERRAGPPWLTPDQSGAVASLLELPWSGAQPAAAPGVLGEPAGNGVPLGVLFRAEESWQLDVWTARRDLVQTVPRGAWEWRLGLRPWPVFVAQVLQLQAQLAELPPVDRFAEAVLGDAADFYETVLQEAPRSRRAVQQLWDRWQQQHTVSLTKGSLLNHGIGELPPAGFLPYPTGKAELADQVQAIFGPNVTVRLHSNSADAAVRAVTEAQHLDRIPLDRPAAKPTVDVWIPNTAADLPAVFTPSYGWIAFARNRGEPVQVAPPATEPVEVYLAPADGDETFRDVVNGVVRSDSLPKAERLATLRYPAAEWGVPTPEQEVADLGEKLRELLRQSRQRLLGVIGTARTDPRRPLAGARAALLPVSFDLDGLIHLPATAAVRLDQPEAIVFVVGSIPTPEPA
ncbi:hypothetical protein [Jatrophihabitans sp.]|uniref:hypothetical protein n=1 Tax=Jatrophihabitans sp. TaxID=1932789 RepID=UPI002B7F9054|nr:hypothetical protein [Jatrophihabitans sp.]